VLDYHNSNNVSKVHVIYVNALESVDSLFRVSPSS